MKLKKSSLWLVRSGGNLLGPYSDREITDMLRNRDIVLLDEISRPFGRWNFVRDEHYFSAVIEELRVRNLKGLSEETTTGTDRTVTSTDSMTQPDDMTLDLSANPEQGKNVQDVMFQSIDDHPKAGARRQTDNAFTYEGDKAAAFQAHQTAKWIWILTAIIIIGASVSVMFSKFVSQPIKDKNIVDRNTSDGIEALGVGDYAKALELFQKAHDLAPDDQSIYIYLGILKIQIAEEANAGRRLLEKLRPANEGDSKRIKIALGIASLIDGDLTTAKSYFDSVLRMDPLFTMATINLGAVAVREEQWAQANNHLLLAVKDGSSDGIEYLMLAMSAARIFKEDKDPRPVQTVARYIRDFISRNMQYRLELEIAASYLESLIAQKYNFEPKIERILDSNFDLTEQHRHNLFIYRNAISWSLISHWCMALTGELDPTARVVAFEALCTYKAGDIVGARSKIMDAVNQRSKDPLVQSVNGYILDKTKSEEAHVSIDRANELDPERKYTQPRRLKAIICDRNAKWDCSADAWQEVLNADSQAIDAYAGLANIALLKGNYERATRLISDSKKLSKNYRPILQLEIKASRLRDMEERKGL